MKKAQNHRQQKKLKRPLSKSQTISAYTRDAVKRQKPNSAANTDLRVPLSSKGMSHVHGVAKRLCGLPRKLSRFRTVSVQSLGINEK